MPLPAVWTICWSPYMSINPGVLVLSQPAGNDRVTTPAGISFGIYVEQDNTVCVHQGSHAHAECS